MKEIQVGDHVIIDNPGSQHHGRRGVATIVSKNTVSLRLTKPFTTTPPSDKPRTIAVVKITIGKKNVRLEESFGDW